MRRHVRRYKRVVISKPTAISEIIELRGYIPTKGFLEGTRFWDADLEDRIRVGDHFSKMLGFRWHPDSSAAFFIRYAPQDIIRTLADCDRTEWLERVPEGLFMITINTSSNSNVRVWFENETDATLYSLEFP